MLSNKEVEELLGEVNDPVLNVPLSETEGIVEIKIKEEKEHISVKLAIGRLGGQEQLDLQMKVVDLLKENGFATVGIRFEELEDDLINEHRGNEASPIESKFSEGKTEFISVASGKGGVGKRSEEHTSELQSRGHLVCS